jgi:1,4-dihydroxy-2-naphthoate octaprenyltransferase
MKRQQYIAAAVGPFLGLVIVMLFISKETNLVPLLIGGVSGIALVLIPIMLFARKKDTD